MPFRASEDFGWFLKQVPGAMLFIGTGETADPLHTVHYDFPDDLIAVGVRTFWALVESDRVL